MPKKSIIETIDEEEKAKKRKALKKKIAEKKKSESEKKAKMELQLKQREVEQKKIEGQRKLEKERRLAYEKQLYQNYQQWYEEQRRMFEESQKTAYEAWVTDQERIKNIYQKATNYISEVYIKLRENKPEYSPLGYYFGYEKWKAELNPNGTETKGAISSGFLKEPIQIICNYIWKEHITSLRDIFLKDVKDAEINNQFVIKCYVINDLDESMISAIKGFRHPNYSVYFYNLQNDILVFNENDEKTYLFSNWFTPNKKPKTLKQLILVISDKNSMFTEKDLITKLKFKPEEAKKLLNQLIEKNQIVDVERNKFAFI